MQFKEIGATIKTLQLVLYAVFVILLFINGLAFISGLYVYRQPTYYR
jgi:hypothetical protein